MANIKVSSENLASVSTQLSSGANELQGTLSQLRGLVDSMGGEWEGAGSTAFSELYAEFNTAGAQLNESLVGISTMLGKAAGYYAESETNVANAFRI
ncbi:WXG100 family type VII secretion target [Plantibacter flavus]|uniref:ESAT-6-like protein n=1 Tax=Plantibacter flavus TaxID=150123 RepID=A0A3N2C4P4_9MICO|nr:WXG100 family type VII secretion target [Plantibacter flavus]ROR82234.1 WXG100 family type VII secretion target [Plantibacter flavus]SMG42583.1 WXG100 family type VII secretion target [Plantibacter flavus]